MDFLQNNDETDDIQEDDNKEYTNNNEIDIEGEEDELEDIENDEANELISYMRDNDEIIMHT